MLTLRTVVDAWQILRDGGLPLATATSGKRRSPAELAIAAVAAVASRPAGRDAEALAAWLFAWHDHWPGAFASRFGGEATAIVEWAGGAIQDGGRYIKLRRIALENLATIL